MRFGTKREQVVDMQAHLGGETLDRGQVGRVRLAQRGPRGPARGPARLHAGVKKNRLLASHGVTVSCGIAEFDSGQTVGFEELIQAADRRMYENKAAKRR